MAIESVAAAQAASPSATALGRSRLATNFETFLTLLTTQLKNQDPLSPLDSNQFTEQLTQMTGVEQQLLTNELLQKLVAGQSTGVADAVSLIGKEVRAVSDEAKLSNGAANWVYKLDGAAANAKLEVLDANGRVVFVGSPSDNAAGEHAFKWDGKGSNGAKQPDGIYTLRVSAVDSGGKAVGSVTFIEGMVTAVEQSNGKTLISVAGAKVPWETVSSVRMAAAESEDTETASNTSPATSNTAPTGSTGDAQSNELFGPTQTNDFNPGQFADEESHVLTTPWDDE
jgi:flagellar basal-body rod modification protein FlgD